MVSVSSTVHNSHNALQVTNLMVKEITDVMVGLTVEKEFNEFNATFHIQFRDSFDSGEKT